MRVSTVVKWSRRIALLRASTIGIIVTSILSVSIALVTYYGDKTGSYVIGVSGDSVYGLALYRTEQADYFVEGAGESLINAAGVESMTNTTYSFLPTNLYELKGGEHNVYDPDTKDGEFLIYTFYVVNRSTTGVPVISTVEMKGNFLSAYEALRIMIIEDSETGTYSNQVIYSFPNPQGEADDTYQRLVGEDENGENVYQTTAIPGYSSEVWADGENGIVCEMLSQMDYKEVRKITIVMWLEGYDDQCKDYIKGGTIRFEMEFVIDRDRA